MKYSSDYEGEITDPVTKIQKNALNSFVEAFTFVKEDYLIRDNAPNLLNFFE